MIFNIISTDSLFNSAVRNKTYKCPFCNKSYKNPDMLYFHVGSDHEEKIKEGESAKKTVYDYYHPIEHLCQICKVNKCIWNEKTGRYSTLCDNPQCREEARRRFKDNYKKKNGHDHTINDPEIQREMMKKRKTSGTHKFQDGGEIPYISSYEKDFLEFCDLNLNIPSEDIRECPYVFYYVFEDKKHFYIPDYYFPKYDLIVEIKADDDITHPKILAVDKEMEKMKDKAVIADKQHNYIKIMDKKYEHFLDLLTLLKNEDVVNKKEKYIIIPERKEDIRGFIPPKLNFLLNEKTMCESFLMKKLLDDNYGEMDLMLVVDKSNYHLRDEAFKNSEIVELKRYKCNFKDANSIKNTFSQFANYYTKKYEHFINQQFMSIRMDVSKGKWFAVTVDCGRMSLQKKLIATLDYYCLDNGIVNYGFIDHSIGFTMLARVENEKDITKFCNTLGGKSEYSKLTFDLSKEFIRVPGTNDADVPVTLIQF